MNVTHDGGLKMLHKGDLGMVTILLNIYEHMKRDYDYALVVVGDPGDGKSRWALNLFETWYRVILKKEVTSDMISQVSQNYRGWVRNFKKLDQYDMNIFDESSRDLNSRDFNTRISKDLTKLFDVFRCKRFFSVIILPSFFRLNKALREERLRGLVWVNKRGHYKFFTRRGIRVLNAMNESRRIKNMWLARPFHQCTYPDYKGVMLEEYLKRKDDGVDEVLNEVLATVEDPEPTRNMVDLYKDDVQIMKQKGMTNRAIAKELEIGVGSVSRCLCAIRNEAQNSS